MFAPHELGTPIQRQFYSFVEAIGFLSTAMTAEEVLTTIRSAANDLMSARGIVILRRSGDDYHCVAEDASVPHWVGSKIDISERGHGTPRGSVGGSLIPEAAFPVSSTETRHKLTMLLAPEEMGFALAVLASVSNAD